MKYISLQELLDSFDYDLENSYMNNTWLEHNVENVLEILNRIM